MSMHPSSLSTSPLQVARRRWRKGELRDTMDMETNMSESERTHQRKRLVSSPQLQRTSDVMPPWDNLITGPLSALMWATEPGRGRTEKLRGICSLHRGDAYPNTTTNSWGRAECGNGYGSGHGPVRLAEETPVKKWPSLCRQRDENNRRTYTTAAFFFMRRTGNGLWFYAHALKGGVCSHLSINREIYLEQLSSRHNQTVNIEIVFQARQPCISDVMLVTHSGLTRSPMTRVKLVTEHNTIHRQQQQKQFVYVPDDAVKKKKSKACKHLK